MIQAMIKFSVANEPIDKNIKNVFKSLKKKGILLNNIPFSNFPDEPQFYQYRCQNILKKATATGASISKNEAYATAMYEAIERYCILSTKSFSKIRGTYMDFKNESINPLLFQAMSSSQLSQNHYRKFDFSKDSVFNWIKGYSLTEHKKVLIPMQLVFIGYNIDENNEPTIRIPISTGAACGPNKEFAIYRGICETIEKDAYMIRYLNKTPRYLLDISEDDELRNIKEKIERYNLSLFIVDITLDFPCISIMAVIIDNTGIGPAVSVGLGTSLNPRLAAKSAISESVMIRSEKVRNFFTNERLDLQNLEKHYQELLRKHQLWSAPHMRFKIKKFLNAPKKSIKKLPNLLKENDKENVYFLVNELKSKGYDVIAVDVTDPVVKSENLIVTKILIPQLFPHYHDENYPYKLNNRLYNILETLGEKQQKITEDTIDPSHPF